MRDEGTFALTHQMNDRRPKAEHRNTDRDAEEPAQKQQQPNAKEPNANNFGVNAHFESTFSSATTTQPNAIKPNS